MAWWHWLLLIYIIGVPFSGLLMVVMAYVSGGYITRPLVVVRNALLWPVAIHAKFDRHAAANHCAHAGR